MTFRAALYGLTKRMMDNMNVQLQYQIQHNLGPWLVWTPGQGAGALSTGAAPAGNIIQATPLSAPSGGPAAPGGPAPMQAPGAPNLNPAVPGYLPGSGPNVLTPPPQ